LRCRIATCHVDCIDITGAAMPHRGRGDDNGLCGQKAWMLPVLVVLLGFGAEGATSSGGSAATCSVGKADGKGCVADANESLADSNKAACVALGFDPVILSCDTCHALGRRLEEAGNGPAPILGECLGCCKEPVPPERFSMARLVADASQQDRDQDLHDFIKRKAPLFPALELENDVDGESRILRADVLGWKSDHLGQFLRERLESGADSEAKDGVVKLAADGAWTAEIQSCSG